MAVRKQLQYKATDATEANNCSNVQSSCNRHNRGLLHFILFFSIILASGFNLAEGNSKKYTMKDFLGKKYTLSSSENFDEFMKEIGVGWFTRKAGAAVSPTVELTEKDGVYKLITTSTFKSQEIEFTPGKEFEEDTLDGRKVKSVITIDGNVLTHIQNDEKKVEIKREFGPEEMKAVMKVADIVCTRVYKLDK